MKKLLVGTFTLCALISNARVIDVLDHGIVPGKDASRALNQLIESVQDEPNVTLSFPTGQYDFHPENAVEIYRTVANHDNGLKRMAFPLFNCKNITVEGNGSLFMMHGRVVPFTLESVDGATLKNFSINWIRSFHAELEVVERNVKAKTFTVEIDPVAYPYSIQDGKLMFERFGQLDPIGSNIIFDPKTGAPVYGTSKYRIDEENATVSATGKNRVEFKKACKVPPPVGTVLIVYGVHPTSRLCHAIQVTNSKDIHIENITVHDAGGMGLIVERTKNITLDGMKVTSAEDRIVSTRADATHFIGCQGTIKLENCLFEQMLDDGINVHGAYVPVVQYLGNNTFLCEISHFQQWGITFAEPGDRLALLSRETILPFFETKVEKVRVLDEKRFELTVSEVPKQLPTESLSVENLTWYPDLVMKDNTIRKNRARSLLVTTKGKVVIENNYFSSQMHGILIEGDNNKWYESGAVEDVIIRNNVFNNIGFAVSGRYPLLASPLFTKTQRMGEGQYHRNINFVGNTIRSFNGLMVKARSVSGLNIHGNKIELSTDYPKANEGASISLEYCDDVAIESNTAKGFASPLIITQTANTTNAKTSRNKGFKRSK